MNHWLICLPRPDMKRCIEKGTFGLNRKYILGSVEKDDNIVCCTSKDWKIIALGSVTNPYYIDTAKVFLADGMFPDRFDFDASILKNSEIDIVNVLDRLSFVKNLAYWAVFFRAGIVKISSADWQLINQLKDESSGTSAPQVEIPKEEATPNRKTRIK